MWREDVDCGGRMWSVEEGCEWSVEGGCEWSVEGGCVVEDV